MGEAVHSIVLFDGVCNLCNASARFIIKRDPRGRFRLAALQSETGRRLLREHGVSEGEMSSVVLVEDGKAYTKSSAALRIARGLRFPWPAMYAFIALPASVRNVAYNFIARNRYRWFGKSDACQLPTPETAARFLE